MLASTNDLRNVYCTDGIDTTVSKAHINSERIQLKNQFQLLQKKLIKFVVEFQIVSLIQTQIIKRINAIKFNVKYCSLAGVSYNPLANEVKGCITPSQSDPILTVFILAHELAHSIDLCSYHVGPSDFSYQPLNWGKILRFSDPNNVEKSFGEYPFTSIIEQQPSEIKNHSLNMLSSKNIPKICQRQKSDELFADTVAFKMLNGAQYYQNEIETILNGFCPKKIPSMTFYLKSKESKKIEGEGRFIWSDEANSMHIDFNNRANNILNLWLMDKL